MNKFTDENNEEFMRYKSSIYTACDLSIMGSYTDGNFWPNTGITQGAFCKTLLNFCVKDAWATDLHFRSVDEYNDKIETRHVFFPYAAAVLWVLDHHSGDFKKLDIFSLKEDGQLDLAKAVAQKSVIDCVILFSKIVYHVDISLHGLMEGDVLATRGWLCDVYAKATKEIFDSWMTDGVANEDVLLKKWLDCGLQVDNLSLIANSRILYHGGKEFYGVVDDICDILNQPKLSLQKEAYTGEVNALVSIYGKLRRIVPITSYEGVAYQYTSLAALSAMIETANKNRETRYDPMDFFVHMSNAEYLNDPDEGQVFLSRVNCIRQLDKEKIQLEKNLIKPKTSYITCLAIHNEEKLPMWVQYGDGGYGCRIEFEVKTKDNFFEVCYLPANDKKLDDDTAIALQDIEAKIEDEFSDKKGICLDYLEAYLTKKSYYFKEDFYKQEKEIRSVAIRQPKEVELRTELRSGDIFPKAYTLLQNPLRVKSVMLGPKCENPEQIALALYQMGIPKVYRSNIHFR